MTNSIFVFRVTTGSRDWTKPVLRLHKAELGGDRRPIYNGELRHKTRRQRHACWGCFGKSRQPLTQQLLLDEVGVLREVVLPKFVIVLHSPILSGLRVMYPVKHTSV
ncbi:hypothetical protein HanOQP8_Chr08g0271101 [Helianthus annuus]|nr:hypothetical protein HanOQP8_Chr08g0271101 [Helianthus annuus]